MKHWLLTSAKARARTDARTSARLSALIATRPGTTSLSAGQRAVVRKAKDLDGARAQRKMLMQLQQKKHRRKQRHGQ
jgi:hypothetical protein